MTIAKRATLVVLAISLLVALAPAAGASGSGGVVLWSRRYNGTAKDDDIAHAIAVSPDGSRVFVTGASDGGRTSLDIVTRAYSADGRGLWTNRYAARDDDVAHAIAVSPDGSKVFVTGESTTRLGWEDYLTNAYSAG
jgi:DNA-binding beta-propeller fold protein YncE